MCTALPAVGFIGLGIMGTPMAKHLCNAGYAVSVYNRTAVKSDAAKQFGAYVAPSPKHLGERSDILITMLTNPAAIEAVMEGPEGALTNPKKGLVWIQMSTLDITTTMKWSERAKACGVIYVDCPVAGSKKQVEDAQLILLAGAEAEALEYVRPILSRLGKTIIDAGAIGKGTALKLCMNLIVAQMTTALAEAVRLADVTQIDPALIFQVIRASPALNCGYFAIKEHALLKRDFSPAFSLDNLLKDVRFMIQEAGSHGASLPVTEAVGKLLQKASAEGLGAKDVGAVYLTLANEAKKP